MHFVHTPYVLLTFDIDQYVLVSTDLYWQLQVWPSTYRVHRRAWSYSVWTLYIRVWTSTSRVSGFQMLELELGTHTETRRRRRRRRRGCGRARVSPGHGRGAQAGSSGIMILTTWHIVIWRYMPSYDEPYSDPSYDMLSHKTHMTGLARSSYAHTAFQILSYDVIWHFSISCLGTSGILTTWTRLDDFVHWGIYRYIQVHVFSYIWNLALLWYHSFLWYHSLDYDIIVNIIPMIS
jgi:hypothetical protein